MQAFADAHNKSIGDIKKNSNKKKEGEKKMLKHLTDKDLKEGKELIQILEDLPESDMKQIIIYASALKDRQLVENSSRKAG
jgi:hypothetical protein